MMFKLIDLQKENETQSGGQFQLSQEELYEYAEAISWGDVISAVKIVLNALAT